jgi:hypothetical protein
MGGWNWNFGRPTQEYYTLNLMFNSPKEFSHKESIFARVSSHFMVGRPDQHTLERNPYYYYLTLALLGSC